MRSIIWGWLLKSKEFRHADARGTLPGVLLWGLGRLIHDPRETTDHNLLGPGSLQSGYTSTGCRPACQNIINQKNACTLYLRFALAQHFYRPGHHLVPCSSPQPA